MVVDSLVFDEVSVCIFLLEFALLVINLPYFDISILLFFRILVFFLEPLADVLSEGLQVVAGVSEEKQDLHLLFVSEEGVEGLRSCAL